MKVPRSKDLDERIPNHPLHCKFDLWLQSYDYEHFWGMEQKNLSEISRQQSIVIHYNWYHWKALEE